MRFIIIFNVLFVSARWYIISIVLKILSIFKVLSLNYKWKIILAKFTSVYCSYGPPIEKNDEETTDIEKSWGMWVLAMPNLCIWVNICDLPVQ